MICEAHVLLQKPKSLKIQSYILAAIDGEKIWIAEVF